MDPRDEEKPQILAYWDMENVKISTTSQLGYIEGVKNFKNVLKVKFPKCKLSVFRGFGGKKLTIEQRLDCHYAGVSLMDVPSTDPNAVDLSLVVDLFRTVTAHPPPSIIFLIAGDSDYAIALKRIKAIQQ